MTEKNDLKIWIIGIINDWTIRHFRGDVANFSLLQAKVFQKKATHSFKKWQNDLLVVFFFYYHKGHLENDHSS